MDSTRALSRGVLPIMLLLGGLDPGPRALVFKKIKSSPVVRVLYRSRAEVFLGTPVPEGLVRYPQRREKIGPLAMQTVLQRGAGKRGVCGTWSAAGPPGEILVV